MLISKWYLARLHIYSPLSCSFIKHSSFKIQNITLANSDGREDCTQSSWPGCTQRDAEILAVEKGHTEDIHRGTGKECLSSYLSLLPCSDSECILSCTKRGSLATGLRGDKFCPGLICS